METRTDDSKDIEFFRDSGLLWFTNRMLHPFGFAISVVMDTGTGKGVGIRLVKTDDPEGMTFSDADNLEAQKRFVTSFWTTQLTYRQPITHEKETLK